MTGEIRARTNCLDDGKALSTKLIAGSMILGWIVPFRAYNGREMFKAVACHDGRAYMGLAFPEREYARRAIMEKLADLAQQKRERKLRERGEHYLADHLQKKREGQIRANQTSVD